MQKDSYMFLNQPKVGLGGVWVELCLWVLKEERLSGIKGISYPLWAGIRKLIFRYTMKDTVFVKASTLNQRIALFLVHLRGCIEPYPLLSHRINA